MVGEVYPSYSSRKFKNSSSFKSIFEILNGMKLNLSINLERINIHKELIPSFIHVFFTDVLKSFKICPKDLACLQQV